MEDRPVRPARPQRQLLGQQGRRGRDRLPVLPERDELDGRGLQERRARLHPQPHRPQFNQLKTVPELVVAINAARATASPRSTSTPTTRTIPDGGASTKALRTRPSATPLGYAIDKPDPDRQGPRRATASSGTTQVPAWQRGMARRAERRPPVRPRPWPARSSMRPATRSRTASASTRKASRSTCSLHVPEQRRRLSQGRPVHPGLVRPDRDQGHQSLDRLGHARDDRVPRLDASRSRASSSTTWSSGAGSATRIRTRCSRS